MKKIVPFKKDIIFKTNLAEIISISLEHTLAISEDNLIKGKFIVSGEYKMLDTSVNTEKFSYDLPFTVDMDDRYILDEANIDIDDFYYEIVNDNVLSVNIDVSIDELKEKEIEVEEPILEEKEIIREQLPLEERKSEEMNTIEERSIEEDISEKRCIEEEDDDKKRNKTNVTELFNTIDSKETYKSYTVYIVREQDTIETIIQKYSITKEELEIYNDLSELKIGDKIVIPS